MARIITLTPNPALDYAVHADFVEPNRKLRCREPQMHPGGGGVNVARATSRLGAHTLAIFTAGGLYGDALIKTIAMENVPMRVIPIAGETRLAFHVQNDRDGDEYRFNLPGAQMSDYEVNLFLRAVDEETEAGDYVVASGSLPPDAPQDLWAKAARIAKKNDARFVLDSISGVKEALEEGVFMLRQNQHEYPALAGKELNWRDEVEAFAKECVSKASAEAMVISHGGDGSIMAAKDGVAFAPSFKIKASSAVGAGDSFVGGLITGLAQGWDNEHALRYGMAAAGATRMSEGTALFKPADVERLYRSET
ncbi:1-phosphofructokinase family hexose kinase [Hyphococcus flavus]|uniref:Phosphofructokinase n=1 Tax=Hyphococcus flavus TaxID=1866326 RepID=A0AAE9ZAL8_9PROT|nr:1-phosphofructokinase family hexose kinase [Hyphococcus flavus]WDI30819.1 1-phosphofructokinase family hexose kinase [Hyphococcus flavus]